ncbi:MAG TPA: CBS domain-containing protein, partial [Blastocatellia bacterium]|nr:CBS domain-containing protein [Blastocatellia bacterium]
TNLCATLQVARGLGKDDLVVFIVADTGERYLSKFQSDEWLKEKRMLGADKMTVGLVAQLKENDEMPHLVSVGPEQQVNEALTMMNAYGLSQIPVLEEGKSVGSLREGKLMAKLLENRDLVQSKISDVMEKGFPVINEDVSVETAAKYLKSSPAILVEEYGRIVGIVTRHDVLNAQP